MLIVRETERARGAMSDDEVREACGNETDLAKALLEAPQIEWFRISQFQQMSLLQIARHLFPASEADELYIPGVPSEKLSGCQLPAPSHPGGSHLYVSKENTGAVAVARELRATLAAHIRPSRHGSHGGDTLTITEDANAMEDAQAFLLLLDSNTWSEDDDSALARKAALAGQVTKAMRKGMKILMAHECDRHERPQSCVPFDTFFQAGQTPNHLKAWNLYGDIAVSLYGGEHRNVSLSLVGLNLLNAAGEARVARPDLVSKSLLATHRPVAARLPWPPSVGMDDLRGGGEHVVESSTSVAEKLRASTADNSAAGEKLSREEQKRRRKASLTAADYLSDASGTKEHPGRSTAQSRGSGDARASADSQRAGSTSSGSHVAYASSSSTNAGAGGTGTKASGKRGAEQPSEEQHGVSLAPSGGGLGERGGGSIGRGKSTGGRAGQRKYRYWWGWRGKEIKGKAPMGGFADWLGTHRSDADELLE